MEGEQEAKAGRMSVLFLPKGAAHTARHTVEELQGGPLARGRREAPV